MARRLLLAAPMSPAEHRATLLDLLADAGVVMLITRAAEGASQFRPMIYAGVDDDIVRFATAIDAAKIVELTADPRIDLVARSGDRHAVVTGAAEVRRERAVIDLLWHESWLPWFPGGRDDRDLAVLYVHPLRGDYWDPAHGRRQSVRFPSAYH